MFTIGEFSKLGRVSARMLRHYDALDLLRPALVGENGYRYYDAAQLATLHHIETLKGYGFPLAEIRALLALDEAALAEHIHKRRIQAYTELNEMHKTLRHMEDTIIRMEGTSLTLNKYHVIVLQNPAQRILGLRRTINIGQVSDLFDELLRAARDKGLTRSGATQLVYLEKEFSYENMDVEAQVEVSGDAPGVRELPACTCVATTHTGPYHDVHHAYEAITAWVAQHPEYQVCGPGIERYLKDEDMAASEEELETGVLFPVVKRK